MPDDEPVVYLEVTQKEGKWDRVNLYKPILRALSATIKGLKEKEIWIPLSELARLEVQGKMDQPRHELLRDQLIHFLKRSNKYKKIYFKVQESSRKDFDRLMKKRGLYQPQMKEYRALGVNLPAALIFRKDRKAWVYSFDEYLPEMLYRADKKKLKPSTGKDVIEEVLEKHAKDLEELEKFRKISLRFAKILRADVKLASKSPTLPYRSWHKATDDRDDIEGVNYFRHKVKAQPKASEAFA